MKPRIPIFNQAICLWLQEGSLWANHAMVPLTMETKDKKILFHSNTAGLSASGELTFSAENEFYIHISLENSTSDPIDTKFNYPYLLYQMDDEDIRVFDPTFGGVLDRIGWTSCSTYPGRASFCLSASATSRQAIACGLFNEPQYITMIRNCAGNAEGHIRFTIEKLTVPPNSILELPVMFIRQGNNWAEAMEPYRCFLQKTFPPQNTRPDWMLESKATQSRAGHCLAPYNPPQKGIGIIIFSELAPARTYEQIKAEIDAAIQKGKEEGYMPLFYQYGWWENLLRIRGEYMFDSMCGDYTAATETARRIVKYIHENGCRTYLYTNAIAAGDESDIFRNSPELFVTDADGLPVYNDLLPMYLFCPSAPGIKDYWDKVLRFILIDMDADGIFLDQIGGAVAPPLCYNPAHHHENTYTYGKDMLKLLSYIRNRAKELKADACVMGELIMDSRSAFLDESHGYGYSKILSEPPVRTEELINRTPSEYYIFTRYLAPWIYTQIGRSSADVLNGAAGSFADDIWKKYHEVFEKGVIPCTTSPCGAISYLFGDDTTQRILGIRADGSIGTVHVTLPTGIVVSLEAASLPQYYLIDIDSGTLEHIPV